MDPYFEKINITEYFQNFIKKNKIYNVYSFINTTGTFFVQIALRTSLDVTTLFTHLQACFLYLVI